MESVINEEYRGMQINCYPDGTEKDADKNKIESFWMVEAKYDGKVKGSWRYNSFRVDPSHPDPKERYFSALAGEIRQSGRDLVDKIIEEKINSFK
jgi:hypothetical protein